jgi:pimeloyl-ACP methyl ester carboxylesterase
MHQQIRIETLLAARLFLAPQVVGERLYFISNLSGRLSLYGMPVGGGIPLPLLPPDIALPNPHHLDGAVAYAVLPTLGQILVMIDQDGDENYQPMLLPIDGGIPEPLFGDEFAGQQVICAKCDPEQNLALFTIDPRRQPLHSARWANLATRQSIELGVSPYGNYPVAANNQYTQVILADSYTVGDVVLYQWRQGDETRSLLFGIPLDQRPAGAPPSLNGIGSCELLPSGNLLLTTSLFDDRFGLGYCRLSEPTQIHPVSITGLTHTGVGELERLEQRTSERYTLQYNIDGSSWVYEGSFDEANLRFTVDRILCGVGLLSDGVLEHLHYERSTGRYVLAFSTATTPVQLYLIEPDGSVIPQTQERILGLPASWLAPGEDASYISHDGLRISARLYLPAPALNYGPPRPVIFYIHGGPQSQERPDFTWFSMPLIQFLTLNGFAVFVPNVRGSTGYGMDYVKRVDHDWGGQDRLDHVAALAHLRQDGRVDTSRAGVMGRSYGGYMTLTLAGRHPELWKAACDLFGPYNLFTFLDRLPETWKTYFYLSIGHPVRDRDLLAERSPSTHLHNLSCPLLVIQGANDPRVVEAESRDLVETLRSQGKTVEYLVFADEGHDVIKYENKVICYNRIAAFFAEHLQPLHPGAHP